VALVVDLDQKDLPIWFVAFLFSELNLQLY